MREYFQRTMAAAAFAEAGEFAAARQLAEQTDNSRKKVVIGFEGPHLPLDNIRQTLQLCQRVGASLEVLHVTGQPEQEPDSVSSAPSLIAQLLTRLNILYHPITGGERPLYEEMVELTRKRRDVVFVVLPSNPGRKKKGGMKNLTAKLPCPVVLFEPTA